MTACVVPQKQKLATEAKSYTETRHHHEQPRHYRQFNRDRPETKGLQGIKVLLPVLKLVGVACASRMRLVTNSL
ncbi:hypothetical protein, partial [Streptomyces sp. NPDC002276]